MTRNQIALPNVKIEYKEGLTLPKLARVRQVFPQETEPDVKAASVLAARKVIEGKNLRGKRIAVAMGSRGIPGLAEIGAAVISGLKEAGAEPFIVPAMGSHGGATADGQAAVLEAYGITEASMGVPVVSSMETVCYGNSDGVDLQCGAAAFHSDGILLINKIKPHTDFHGEIESGLVKMSIIGLGKHAGAAAFHSLGFAGFSQRLQNAFPMFLNSVPLLGGIAVIQNAYDRLSVIEGISAAEIMDRERELLKIARNEMPAVPVGAVDLLILDEIGKNISGSGFDPNVFAWKGDTESAAGAGTVYDRLYIKSLTEESEGHGTGAWCSDVLSLSTVNAVDWGKTWTNCMTLNLTHAHGIPVILENDLACLRTLVNAYRPEQWDALRVLRVRNTLDLETFDVSPALWDEMKSLPGLTLMTDFLPLDFDADGNLKKF